VFVGSANATGAAFGGNVEFLVELRGGATKLGVEATLDFENGLGPILEPYDPVGGRDLDPIEEALRQLLNLLRAIAEQPFTATVRRERDEYTEVIATTSRTFDPTVKVTVELLTLPGRSAAVLPGVPLEAELGPVPLDLVTPFLAVHAAAPGPNGGELRQATVVRCRLVDDPAGRLDEILARQVDTPEKFLRFLLLLLGVADPATFLGGRTGLEAVWDLAGQSNGIFELLGRAVADRPEVLGDLDRLIPRLRATATGAQVLPPGFDQLWDVIDQARPALAELHGQRQSP
jgi:hypothetical protein